MNLAVWALQNYRLRGKPFSFERHQMFKDLMLDDHPEQCTKKSAQAGASEKSIIQAIYMPHYLGGTTLYFFPTRNHIGDFVQHRVQPVIEDSPSIRRVTGMVKEGNRRGADKVGLMRIGRGFLYMRGLQSRSDAISVPGDQVIIDEYDECNVENAGLARERLEASEFKYYSAFSTPKWPDTGVDGMYQRSDQREYRIRCAHCGEWQSLDWFQNFIKEIDTPEGKRWAPRDLAIPRDVIQMLYGERWRDAVKGLHRDMRACCMRCGKPIDRCKAGEWVARYPGRSVHGWHVTRLYLPISNMAEMFHKWMDAQTSVLKLLQFYNMGLGLAKDSGVEGLTRDRLARLAERNAWYNPAELRDVQVTTAGVDVGAVMNVQISKVVGGRRYPVYKGALGEFEDVKRVCRTYGVDLCVMDARPETRKAREFRSEMPHGKVYLADYGLQATGKGSDDEGAEAGDTLKTSEDWIRFNHLDCVLVCDRTMVIDEATAQLTADDPMCIFPADWVTDPVWVDQMIAPKRQYVARGDGRGGMRAVWVEGSQADHYRHADVYDMLAFLTWKDREGFMAPPERINRTIADAQAAEAQPRPEDYGFGKDGEELSEAEIMARKVKAAMLRGA